MTQSVNAVGPLRQIVVVGSSLAGVRACGGLRAAGFEGELTLVGDEPHQPYDRPPLSKKVLSGEWEPDRISLFRGDEATTLDLNQRLGSAAVSLQLAERTITLEGGATLGFDGLIIATGSGLRRLPGQPDHPSVMELRTLDDSLALRARLASGDQRVVVVGAGFIGLEVAATARQLGNTVTVLEGAPAPLIRGLGVEMGMAVTALHEDNGVTIHCRVQVRAIRPGDLSSAPVDIDVRWADGADETLTADVVVVGIGVIPNTAWLEGSGVQLRDGVVCDQTLNSLSSDGSPIPGVYAAGDIARWPNGQFDGEEMRIEHWTNASEQGMTAARNLLAVANGEQPTPYETVPFFWSDQFAKRIQFIGRAAGDDDVRIVRGSVEDRSFLALYGKHGRLRGALALAMPKPLMQCRNLLLDRMTFDDAIAAVTAWP
ncbi:MAG: FAD/NAD(P)-binding oxidoreductase [Ilumatobacteraceae bacterium]